MSPHSRFIILFAFIIVAIGPSQNAEATVISQCNPYDRSCVCERGVLPCMPDCFWHPSDPRCGRTSEIDRKYPRSQLSLAAER